MNKPIIIAMSGASGVIYGIRLLELLRNIPHIETHLIMSKYARLNIEIETAFTPKYVEGLANIVHNYNDQASSIASGSFKTSGMIVTPCSIKTLSAIVQSHASNLIVRAADVILKEQRRLIIMPRETPLHQGHCKLLYEASQLGVIIAPPMPAFYNKPQSIDDIINHNVARVLDLLDIDTNVIKRWNGYPKALEDQ